MNTTQVRWLNLVLVFSLLLPIAGWAQTPREDPAQTHTIYLPLARKDPALMGYVPEGEFQMGCWDYDYCSPGGKPQHAVFLDGYFLDKYKVTNAQYAQCVAAGACIAPGANGSHTRSTYYGNPDYSDYPVIHISWDNAQDYCQWAGKRLPTEAEWEKAAQGGIGGTKYVFPWGDEMPVCDIGASNGAQYDECSPDDTVKVGSFGSNGYGLYDMAGNVYDWVNDYWDPFYYSFSPYSNPPGPASGSDKVNRGGSWNYNLTGLRVDYRNFRDPDTPLGNHDIGIRCAYSPPF